MKYAVYQINTDRDAERLKFTCFDVLMEITGGKVPIELYDKVYEEEIQRPEEEKVGMTLDVIYNELNFHKRRHPGFRRNTLSCSDIVELDGVRWYCDSFGWKRIER